MPRANLNTIIEISDETFSEVASALVRSGRFVPGLTVEPDGRARSWWWPMPAATHRGLVASLVVDDSMDGQRLAAGRLADTVDEVVRRLLTAGKLTISPRRSGPFTELLGPLYSWLVLTLVGSEYDHDEAEGLRLPR